MARPHHPDACEALATVLDELSHLPPRQLLAALGSRVAGVPAHGPLVLPALVAGGRDRLRGGGFLPELRDHTAGQARHFAGIARSVTVLGAGATRWASVHVRRDAADTPDGRLTDLAVLFASRLLDGTLAPDDAGDWVRRHVCGR
ncbi:hypothetical protein [Nocardioides flavescens]|uniref:Uncharacterized protein n=1 Tax=Nocardioides flavescens TaxID=2691959 RepID=A0A6L7F158_9ACTN|nr:hypothetical protein [Nocardioides flavescens]MXG88664.1 hypothetical protein [Nocardioides flavescens]